MNHPLYNLSCEVDIFKLWTKSLGLIGLTLMDQAYKITQGCSLLDNI